jgi:hypothetical protein
MGCWCMANPIARRYRPVSVQNAQVLYRSAALALGQVQSPFRQPFGDFSFSKAYGLGTDPVRTDVESNGVGIVVMEEPPDF